MNRWAGLGLLLITAGALALRCPDLALRPLHNDEAVNADKINGLWQAGHYRYDPNEHHGPTLYYTALPFIWLSGAPDYDHLSESTLRAVAVFFGVALVGLLWWMRDGLGVAPALLAAGLTAISPAMVFYSRYFIHEMLLVCFTLLIIIAGWRYSQKPGAGWAALAGAGLGLICATKETFVFTVAAMSMGLILCVAWGRWIDGQKHLLFWNLNHALIALGMAAAIALVFFTSFFTNASGPADSLRTYIPWLKRAGGESPHIHPWWFYLERLFWFKQAKGPRWSEGLILLLAACGGVAALSRRWSVGGANRWLARFLVFYTVILTAIYSSISYKTPWCLLGFWHGMILLAGIGAATLVELSALRSARLAVSLLLLAGIGQLTWQSWRASYVYAADRRNPYVYAQTLPDVLRLVDKVKALSKLHPDGPQMVVKVMVPESDYWPLPWYWRGLRRVGWWGQIPSDPYAPVMIVGARFRAALDEKSDKRWLMVGYTELRPKAFLELYVQYDLWEKYVQSLPKERDE
jgi:uncharacterized protein (TIGR03663 family)